MEIGPDFPARSASPLADQIYQLNANTRTPLPVDFAANSNRFEFSVRTLPSSQLIRELQTWARGAQLSTNDVHLQGLK